MMSLFFQGLGVLCFGFFFLLGAAVLWLTVTGGDDDPRLDQTAKGINGLAMLHSWLRHRGKIVNTIICYNAKREPVDIPHRTELTLPTGEKIYAYRAFDFNKRDFLENFNFRPNDGEIT